MEGDTDSFIVRIWCEAMDPAGNVLAWKGYIEQVGSDQHLHFQDLDMMARFIQHRCRLPLVGFDQSDPDAQTAR